MPRKLLLYSVPLVLVVAIAGGFIFYLTQGESTLDPDKADEYLLTLDDMPSGWAIDEESSSDEESDSTFLCSDFKWTNEKHGISFQKSQLGPFLGQVIFIYSDSSSAQDAFEEALGVIDNYSGCESDPDNDDEVKDLSFPDFGDDTKAFRIQSNVLEVDTVIILHSNSINLFFNASAISVSGSVDSELTEEFVQKAMGKLP
jgi:hypothetical protein